MLLVTLVLTYVPTYTNAGPQALDVKVITFDDLAPRGITLKQSWNALGMDTTERVYIGFTSTRPDGREDFLVFRYDPKSGERKFLGSFMEASERANNLAPGEEIPKGHTRMIEINGRMYMGSQGFHDFKGAIDTLPNYRGAHLYAYDIAKDHLEDVSRYYSNGVVVEQQGIVALSVAPSSDLLVGLTHPLGDIVLLDVRERRMQIVRGIPWTLGNPVSREIVVTKTGLIYTYRGTEELASRSAAHPIWAYDLATGALTPTRYSATGGFWNGQTATRDGQSVYLSTVHGELYHLAVSSGAFTYLGRFLPAQSQETGAQVNWLFGITLSNDEKRVYAIPQTNRNVQSELYAYDIATGKVNAIGMLPPAFYTGSHMRDSHGNIYFARFGNGNIWEGQASLVVVGNPDAIFSTDQHQVHRNPK
jgi:hypothetical protein